MTKKLEFDYIIIGGGLAGLQLALAFSNDSFFSTKKIAIIEPHKKTRNDKTWCFWEMGAGKWDNILHHSWSEGVFITRQEAIPLSMGEYRYKMIRAEDFYDFAYQSIKHSSNISFISDTIQSVHQKQVQGEKLSYTASSIFDSRIPLGYENDQKSITLLQSFKGWIIETERDQFNPDSFTMMDFRLGYEDQCCFTYILPLSKRKALVEFTFFAPETIEDKVYEKQLKKFISEQLSIEKYTISEVEQGVIPMSTYPFWKANRSNYLKIGTGGGWVKSSSGYSFKNVEKKVTQVLKNIKDNKALDHKLFNKRFRFYDEVLLNILFRKNELGLDIFEEMYSKNSTSKIFQFLDEETTFTEEIKIINKFKKAPFLKSAFQLLIQ
ncbi:MAG: lycopene cyclase [Flavobacteriales bacterium]|nr:lycopene cyclase [Flavobacteriales bacterium]